MHSRLVGLVTRGTRRLHPIAVGVGCGSFATALWATQSQAQEAPKTGPVPATVATSAASSGAWAWPAAGGGTGLRVASYNVLSDGLCDAEFFDCCAPADVDNRTRLERIKRKLEAEMQRGAIICLQEISRNWAGELLPLYEKHGYGHMVCVCCLPVIASYEAEAALVGRAGGLLWLGVRRLHGC